jgi:predicted Zn finger-like uncharacterized protein
MDIRCDRCGTEYELDEAQVPDAGIAIKCATCEHVFTVTKPTHPPVTVRIVRDGVTSHLTIPDEDTLVQWIGEGRLLRSDVISFDGASWTALGDVPEIAGGFGPVVPAPVPSPVPPVLSQFEQTPLLGGIAIPPAPAPAPAANFPALSLPADLPTPAATKPPTSSMLDATTPDLPKVSLPIGAGGPALPKLSLPADPSTPKFESRGRASAAPPPRDSGRKGTDSSASLGKLNRPVEGAPPTPGAGLQAPAFPSLSLPSDTAQSIPPVSAPRTSARETAPVSAATRPSTPPVKPTPPPVKAEPAKAERTTVPPEPRSKPAPPPTARPSTPPRQDRKPERKVEDTDTEIAAFQQQGKGGRIAATVLVTLAVIGGAGYSVFWFSKNHLPPEAKVPYEKGRTLYLNDVRSSFAEADADYEQALKIAGSAPFADAWGARAELQAAWAEQFLNKWKPLSDLAAQKQKTAKAADNKELMKEANAVATLASAVGAELKDHQQKVEDYARKALDLDKFNVPASRALIQYFYPLSDDVEKAQKEATRLKEILKGKPVDGETRAVFALVDGSDAKQARGAEDALKGVLQNDPQIVHAWSWLAAVHKQEGNIAAAVSDLEALEKMAPGHQGATEALVALKPGSVKPEEAKPLIARTDEKPTKPQPAQETKPAGAKPPPEKATDPAKTPDAALAYIDVDKLVETGNKFLDKGKNAKALATFDKVLAAKPTVVDALFGRALALASLNKTDSAIAAYRKTLEVSPKFGDAMLGLAEALKKKGQNREAVRFYKQYLDAGPKDKDSIAVAKANIEALK